MNNVTMHKATNGKLEKVESNQTSEPQSFLSQLGKKILTPYRSRLLPENVEATLCTKSWLYGFEATFFIVIIIQF